ncbi:hypothetical protein ABW19_dt0206897 [Dactylella cylindrospora]|nr:hypothetical protein ABW19_dt0206897 [Dactylella cylindrospora]
MAEKNIVEQGAPTTAPNPQLLQNSVFRGEYCPARLANGEAFLDERFHLPLQHLKAHQKFLIGKKYFVPGPTAGRLCRYDQRFILSDAVCARNQARIVRYWKIYKKAGLHVASRDESLGIYLSEVEKKLGKPIPSEEYKKLKQRVKRFCAKRELFKQRLVKFLKFLEAERNSAVRLHRAYHSIKAAGWNWAKYWAPHENATGSLWEMHGVDLKDEGYIDRICAPTSNMER